MQILKAMFAYILGSLIIVIFALICLSSGRYALPIEDIIQVLCGYGDETQNNIVFYFRLPRILVAIIVGAGLSVAGGAFQSLFRNPLATPDILGVTSGASFGAVLGLLLGLSMDYISIAGFIFGILSLALVVYIGYNKNMPYQTTTMILSGIIVGALFQSLIGYTKKILGYYQGKIPKQIHDNVRKEEEKNFAYPNRYPINNESIGIEVVGKATDLRKLPIDNKYPQITFYAATWDTSEQTDQTQKDSIKNLVEILKTEYNLTENDIYEHDDISPQKTRGEAKDLYEKE
ncbi:hypothetical protein T36_0579 [Helicobacter cinaedi]|uniref:iron chelate uptake ABC transporter family permease subunit n=1 Tax=Helicobacter cinaedi TaxID=213 RepID=UPI001EEDF132|nr:iron chelate uptake ABC transporter family permease subunit [Helicobacter cinaedi]BDB64132.1 hypothetical protein T36_0579 [Helicobacter cinaedi]